MRESTDKLVARFAYGDGTRPFHDPWEGPPPMFETDVWTREYAAKLWPIVRSAAWWSMAVNHLDCVHLPDDDYCSGSDEDHGPIAAYEYDGLPGSDEGVAAFDGWRAQHRELVEEVGDPPLDYYRARLMARERHMRTREA